MAPAADESPRVRDSDGELLSRIAERDLEAFQILHRRYARAVYGLALRRLRVRESAEDATRRAFAAIWRSAPTEVPERGGGARWLFTVAESAIADDASAPDEDDWLAFRVHAAVAELPEQERVPLELVYWGGCSRGEIAEQLGLPLGTIETRIRSALVRLATSLER